MTDARAGRLSVGIPAVDDEHWLLLTLLTRLRAALDAGAAPAVTAELVRVLRRVSGAHFATEERLMREHRYPMATSHLAQHQRFLDELTHWTAAGAPALTRADVEQLEAWFARHVEIADAPLADWLLHPR
jgi:hemerythrin-like metal-binding protein